jgi:SpoVK/Ycf46/Vps4 family AAA+-type ATPase
MLAKAVASECSCTFLNVSASTLGSKWRGESEKLVRILFEIAAYYSPSTIFIDEIDSIAGARGGANEHESSRRVKTELMVQMDGMNSTTPNTSTRPPSATSTPCSSIGNDKRQRNSSSSFNPQNRKSSNVSRRGRGKRRNGPSSSDGDDSDPDHDQEGSSHTSSSPSSPSIIVIAATNTPWDLDEALRRRFEKRIYIPLPDQEGRTELFRLNMKSIEVSQDINFTELGGQLSEGYTGADISNICRDAAMMGIRRFLDDAKKNGLTNQEIQHLLKSNNFQENSSVSLDISNLRLSSSSSSAGVGSGGTGKSSESTSVLSLHSTVTRNDFLLSFRKINRSINSNDLKKFENWMNQYGSS